MSQEVEPKTTSLVSPAAAIADHMPKPFFSAPVEFNPTAGWCRPHDDVSAAVYMGRGGRGGLSIAMQLIRKEWQNVTEAKASVLEE